MVRLTLLSILLMAAPASAATSTVSQCNGVAPSAAGATTSLTCTVTIVNRIDHGVTSSTTTVTRQCALGPCPGGNGTFTTSSPDLVTRVDQCNGSDNDAAQPITCRLSITTDLTDDTPGALPLVPATVDQCVGSGGGGGGTVDCSPYPATTTGATVTQCNSSANGGGGTVRCDVGAGSSTSPAAPVTVNQCNGSGNSGGSVVTCEVTLSTRVRTAASTSPSASAGPTTPPSTTASPSSTAATSASPTTAPTAPMSSPTTAGSGMSGSAAPTAGPASPHPTASSGAVVSRGTQVTRVPVGGVQAGGGGTAGLRHVGLLETGAALLYACAVCLLGHALAREHSSRPGR